MDCNFRGCDCWYCIHNDPQFICKHYVGDCYKKPQDKTIANCKYMETEDSRSLIFKKVDRIVRFSKSWFNVVRLNWMLTIGYLKDNVFRR